MLQCYFDGLYAPSTMIGTFTQMYGSNGLKNKTKKKFGCGNFCVIFFLPLVSPKVRSILLTLPIHTADTFQKRNMNDSQTINKYTNKRRQYRSIEEKKLRIQKR